MFHAINISVIFIAEFRYRTAIDLSNTHSAASQHLIPQVKTSSETEFHVYMQTFYFHHLFSWFPTKVQKSLESEVIVCIWYLSMAFHYTTLPNSLPHPPSAPPIPTPKFSKYFNIKTKEGRKLIFISLATLCITIFINFRSSSAQQSWARDRRSWKHFYSSSQKVIAQPFLMVNFSTKGF